MTTDMQTLLAQFSQFVLAQEAAKTATAQPATEKEKTKPGPKPGKKASELEALRAEVAALKSGRSEPAKVQAASPAAKVEVTTPKDYSAVWTALKSANISHYGTAVRASSWASAQLEPIFGAAFGAKKGESKKGSPQWDVAIAAGKAAQEAATPAILSAAAKLAGVDFSKLVG